MTLGHWIQKARLEMSKGNFVLASSHLNEALSIALYVCMWPINDHNVKNIQQMRHTAFRARRSHSTN